MLEENDRFVVDIIFSVSFIYLVLNLCHSVLVDVWVCHVLVYVILW